MSFNSSKIESMTGRAGSFLLDVKEAEIIRTEFFYNSYSEDERSNVLKPEFAIGINDSQDANRYIKVTFVPPPMEYSTPDNIMEIVRSLAELDSGGINVIEGANPLLTEKEIMSENDFGGNLFTGVTFKIPEETDDLRDLVKESASIAIDSSNYSQINSYSTTDFLQSYSKSLKDNGFLFTHGKDSLPRFFSAISNQNLGRDNSQNVNSLLPFNSSAFYFSAVLKDISNSIINNSSSIFGSSLRKKYTTVESITGNAQNELRTMSNPMSNYFPIIDNKKVFDNPEVIEFLLNNNTSETFLRDQIYNSTDGRNILHVGYIFSATLELENGDIKIIDPKLVINNQIQCIYLKNVAYNTSASIRMMPVYVLNLPVLNINSIGHLVRQPATIFVSGKGQETGVTCIDRNPPPPPQDLIFNLTNKGLEMNWSLPYNIQKDISKFRIFKRKNLSEPFTLVRQIDFGGFDDPIVPDFLNEKLKKGEIKTFFTDKTFDEDSDFIYALTCVDVHDLTSNYSEQIRVKVNPVFNRLETSLVARLGAYIPYPNMTIEEEIFSDVIKSSGYTRAKIYFNPDFLRVFKKEPIEGVPYDALSEDNLLNINQTDDNLFKLNLINIDLQEQQNLDIIIGEKVVISDFESGDSAIIKSFIEEDISL